MAWQGGTGSGDLITASADTIATGVLSAQQGVFGTARTTGVASLASLHAGDTVVSTDSYVASKANFGLGDFNVNSVQGAFALAEVTTAPVSGEWTVGGWLYVQSGGLHFLGKAGTVTLVATT